jgi:hypothetical protein
MNHFRRFQQDDMVTYTGSKFAKELHGALGIVVAHVQGSDNGIVVAFGKDAYILDETKHLTRFQGKLKTEGSQHEPKGPAVEKRKGVGGGGKRRVVDQDASE